MFTSAHLEGSNAIPTVRQCQLNDAVTLFDQDTVYLRTTSNTRYFI